MMPFDTSHGRLGPGQFVVETTVGKPMRDKNHAPIFFGQHNGRSVLFHAGYYRRPQVEFQEILAGDWKCELSEDMVEGMAVRAVCEQGPRGPRAVYWCRQEDYWSCVEERDRQIEEANQKEKLARAIAERVRQKAEERWKREATENPRNIEEAIAHGWQIREVNGRQCTLYRQFSDQNHPRVITRYRPKNPESAKTAKLTTV